MPFGFEQRQTEERMKGNKSIPAVKKLFVNVQCLYTTDAQIVPQVIIFDDGRKFEINKVTDVRNAASLKVGGMGIRYTVKIGTQERYLFFDANDRKWFVEGKES